MSNFTCEQCGAELIDSPNGYISECPHYPKTNTADADILEKARELIEQHAPNAIFNNRQRDSLASAIVELAVKDDWVKIESADDLPSENTPVWVDIGIGDSILGWFIARKALFVTPDGADIFENVKAYIPFTQPEPFQEADND